MAKDDDKLNVTRGEFNALADRLTAFEKAHAVELEGQDEALAALIERLDAIEKHPALSIPPLPASAGAFEVSERAREASRALRDKGEAVLRNGSFVRFHPADGLGPADGWAAIVCASRIVREGYVAHYTLWVLVPKKAHWEEGVREGIRAGEFEVA